MQLHDYQKRKTKITKKRQNSYVNNISGSMGDVQDYGSRNGNDQIRVSGENSKRTSRYIFKPISNSTGGIISQLRQEAQEQLAYHNEQIEYHQQQSRTLEDKLSQLDKVYYQLKNNE